MRTLMKVLKNLFGNNTKISAEDIVIKDLNNKGKLLNNCVIIDNGVNENGTYVKWGNGIMMCTKKISFTTKFNVAWGVFYETPSTIPIGFFAKPFVDIPILSITSATGSTVIPESTSGLTKNGIGGIYLARPVKSDSEMSGTIDIIAIGKWK